MNKEGKKTILGHYKKALGSLIFSFVFGAFLFSLGSFIGGVISPLFYKGIIDSLTIESLHSQILYYFTLFFIAGFAQLLFSRMYEFVIATAVSKALKKIASYALILLTKHSYQFFTDNFAGSLVTKTRKFVSAFETMSDIIVLEFLYALVNITGILFVLYRTSKTLATVASLWFLVFFLFTLIATKKRIPLEKKKGEIDSRVTGVLADIVTNALNLKIFSSKKREEGYFDKVLEEDHIARMNAWWFANKAYSLQGLITLCAQSSLILLSIYLWNAGEVTSGTIVLVMSYSGTLFMRLSGLGSAIRRFFDAHTNASEFVEILNKEIEIKDPEVAEESCMKKGEIVFEHVSFSYKQSKDIFSDFNLKIKAGEKIGIIGTSGAGKTTITKLLLRFADVTSGCIKIDGQDIRKVNQDDLRRAIAYVPQDPILFHRKLGENIAYGKPDVSSTEIVAAAKEAHAHEFIENLSHGYDTLVGERGVKLSGGERQRVAIARAILKNSPILILDEATSSLDSVSETHIKDALDRLMEGRTTIVVAHRLSTIEKMDRIIVLEKGQIVEEGSHKELIAKQGIYQNFWNHQNKGFIGEEQE